MGHRFRCWRRAHKHMTQAQFARALGISVETVRKIEQGKRKAGRKTKAKFEALRERHQRSGNGKNQDFRQIG